MKNKLIQQTRHPGLQKAGIISSSSLPFLLSVREVAQLLRTSCKAIYAMIDRGQLPGVTRIGRRILIYRDDLLTWLEERRAPSPEENWR